jgi:uncharacterized protein (TIRG00374 family)
MTALRKRAAEVLGVDAPKVEPLQRVSLGKIAMLGFGAFAAYTLISGLADVGFDVILDALREASWPMLVGAVIAAALTNATDAVAIVALSPKPVPVGVTTMEQMAISFVNLAVPSSAGRLAVNARFFQKFGISPITSTSTSMIVSVVGFVAQLALLAITVLVGHQSVDLSSLQGGGKIVKLLVMAVVIGLAAVGVVALVPKLRAAAKSKLREPMAQLRNALKAVRDPWKVAHALAGSLGTEVLYAFGLLLCVEALGGSVTLGQAVFINITVSLFAGATPVPGGVGVAEAGLTAGLVSIGVASEIAVPAVILYRMASYYLPPIWGWVCMQWLDRHDFL